MYTKGTKMKKILVFGNPLVPQDSLALKVAKTLQKEFVDIEFKELDAVEEIQNEGKNLIILDVVQGLKKTIVIDNLDQIKTTSIYTMHDFDLAWNLKLLKKIGAIEEVKIIGTPMNYAKKNAVKETKKIITSLLLKNE